MRKDLTRIFGERIITGTVATLLVMLVFHASVNFYWLSADNFPLWFDFGGYFRHAVQISHASERGIVDLLQAMTGTGSYSGAYNPWRPILPLAAFPWLRLAGPAADTAVFSCFFFFALALITTYGLARVMFNRGTGLLAAFILSVSPGFFCYSRRFSPEFASAALVALGLYFLYKASWFSVRRYSLLAGAVLGLALLAKEMSAAYMLGPILYSAARGARGVDGRLRMRNAVLALLSLSAVTAPVYIAHAREVFHSIFAVAYSADTRLAYGMAEPFGAQGLFFYLRDMFTFSLLPVQTWFCLAGVLLLVVKFKGEKGFLLSWLAVSYVALITTQTRAGEYALPLLPAAAIAAAYAIMSITGKGWARKGAVICVVFWGLLEFYAFSFPGLSLGQSALFRKPSADAAFRFYPQASDWQLDRIVGHIGAEAQRGQGPTVVHVGANGFAFSPVTLAYAAEQQRLKMSFCSYAADEGKILASDFVLIKSGDDQGIFYSPAQALKTRELVKKSNLFVPLSDITLLPDGSSVEIFKRRGGV